MTRPSDATLVRRAQRGSRDAAPVLFARHLAAGLAGRAGGYRPSRERRRRRLRRVLLRVPASNGASATLSLR